MSEQIFRTENEAKEFLKGHILERLHVTTRDAVELANIRGVVHEEKIESLPPGAAPALSKRFRWVIRDDDLQWMDALLDGLKASASAGFFVMASAANPATWAAVVAILAVLFKVSRHAVKKGKRLDERLFDLIFTLHESEGAESEELLARLRERDATWTMDEIEAGLKVLGRMPMNDGTIRELVSQLPNRQWRVSGI